MHAAVNLIAEQSPWLIRSVRRLHAAFRLVAACCEGVEPQNRTATCTLVKCLFAGKDRAGEKRFAIR